MAIDVERRPSPPGWEVPDGYEWRVVPDDGWRIAIGEKRCRRIEGNPRRGCGRPAVAELRRGASWWAYCPDHMYGRWLATDGRRAVLTWRLWPVST